MDPTWARLACFCFGRGVCEEVDVIAGVVGDSEDGFRVSEGGLGGVDGGTSWTECRNGRGFLKGS